MKQRNGFTLIELLVVVAIIIALLAILLPSLSPAVGYAETVKCAAGLRNIMFGAVTYSTDNFGSLPHPNWGSTLSSTPGWLYSGSNNTLQEHVKTGAIWRYIGTEEVYHCPSHAKPWGDGGRPTEALTSYCMNGSVVNYGSTINGEVRIFRIGDFRGGDIVFWEQDENGGAGLWNDGSNFPNELITPRHTKAGQLGAGNVAMPDGSVEWISLTDFNTEAIPAKPAKRTRLWNVPHTDKGWADPT